MYLNSGSSPKCVDEFTSIEASSAARSRIPGSLFQRFPSPGRAGRAVRQGGIPNAARESANTLRGHRAEPTQNFSPAGRGGAAVCVRHLLRLRIADSCQVFGSRKTHKIPVRECLQRQNIEKSSTRFGEDPKNILLKPGLALGYKRRLPHPMGREPALGHRTPDRDCVADTRVHTALTADEQFSVKSK